MNFDQLILLTSDQLVKLISDISPDLIRTAGDERLTGSIKPNDTSVFAGEVFRIVSNSNGGNDRLFRLVAGINKGRYDLDTARPLGLAHRMLLDFSTVGLPFKFMSHNNQFYWDVQVETPGNVIINQFATHYIVALAIRGGL